MHVEYYNKNGEKVEFDVKPPNAEGWLNVYGIKDDGTYTNSLISGYA